MNRDYIVKELIAARAEGWGPSEMHHLGAAIHALQDSYSSAHVWRDDSVYAGDARAPVQSINLFEGLAAEGLTMAGKGSIPDWLPHTHDHAFDEAPVDSGTARAALEATFEVLKTYEDGHREDPARAEAAVKGIVGEMFQSGVDGVTVNTTPDATWEAERDRRLELETLHTGESAGGHNQSGPEPNYSYYDDPYRAGDGGGYSQSGPYSSGYDEAYAGGGEEVPAPDGPPLREGCEAAPTPVDAA